MNEKVTDLKPKNWSYSSLSLYEKCPRSFYLSKTLKLPRRTHPAAERGIAIHAKGEHYLLGDIPTPPNEFNSFKSELRNLKQNGAKAEAKHGLTKNWKRAGWNRAWVRMILDAQLALSTTEMLIVDFKTGGIYESHSDQAHLYATAIMAMNPKIKQVYTEFWYLDKDVIKSWDHNATLTEDFKDHWNQRCAPIFNDQEWKPTPSANSCRFCDFKEMCDAYKG